MDKFSATLLNRKTFQTHTHNDMPKLGQTDFSGFISAQHSNSRFIHNLQMQKLTATTLVLGLALSSWIMWTAEGMRQSLLIATTMELVTTAVHIFKMQE